MRYCQESSYSTVKHSLKTVDHAKLKTINRQKEITMTDKMFGQTDTIKFIGREKD